MSNDFNQVSRLLLLAVENLYDDISPSYYIRLLVRRSSYFLQRFIDYFNINFSHSSYVPKFWGYSFDDKTV